MTATDPDGYWSAVQVVVHLDDVELPARMSAPSVEFGAEALTLRLSWTAPSNADDADLTTYRYTYQPTGSTDSSERVIHGVSLDATSVIVDGVSVGSYDFWVRAEGSEASATGRSRPLMWSSSRRPGCRRRRCLTGSGVNCWCLGLIPAKRGCCARRLPAALPAGWFRLRPEPLRQG